MTAGRNPNVFRGVLVLTGLVAAGFGRQLLAADEATLDAPDQVCVGEEFDVDWSGPNGGGALKHRFFDVPENDVLSKML